MEIYEITEGTVIYYKDIIWIAKGIRHPPKFAVAFPRYHKQGRIRRVVLSQTMMSDCVPSPQPHIPLDRAIVYDPRNLLRKSQTALRLVKKLEGLGCEFGLTGSMAVFGEGRDVDLIAFNEWCFESLYYYLKELKEKGRIKPLKGKWDGIGEKLRKWRLGNSVLEGVLDGIPFSLKMVKQGEDCKRPVKVKTLKTKGKIIAVNNFVFPYLYKIGDVFVEALRLQFSELNNVKVNVKCNLEIWTDREVCTLSKDGFLELE